MNKLEVADLIEQIPQYLTPDEFLVALATKAAEVEREACAKVLEGISNAPDMQAYANAIRARGEK
jgi:hypothetical protein